VLTYGVAIAVALLIPLVTRGSYTRLFKVEWHLAWLLFAGLAIQIFLEFYTLPRDRWDDLGFGLLVASYVFIFGFCFRNLVLRGMGIVIIGIACNFLVITLNQGMPVKIPEKYLAEEWAQPTVKHHPQQPDDRLRVLTDIIVLDHPWNTVISFGDIILCVGLIDLAYWGSRKPKPRRAVSLDEEAPAAVT
jgi:hypothetical protein